MASKKSKSKTSKSKPKRGAKKSASRSSFRKPRAKAKPRAKPRAAATRPSRAAPPSSAGARALGEVTVPSGKLAMFDIGLVGYLPREALDPAIVTCEVPRDRALRVVGVPIGKGRFADCWDHVAVELGVGEPTHSKKLGEAGVDFARIVCMDYAALDAWQHDDSLDGNADVVFWGRDDRLLAHSMNAPRIDEGYGWLDLSLAEAERKSDEIARRKAANKWLLATDYRPHSHHYHALAAARRSAHGAWTLELAGTQMILFFTSWGDGVFPIYADYDHDDRLVRVRIQLATPESNAAMASVNP